MPTKPARLFGVTLLTLGVLTIACLNLLRLMLSLEQWQFLRSLAGVSPLYQALTGLIWAVTGFAVVWGLWRRKRWALRAAGAWSLLYALYHWLDRLLLTGWLKSGEPPANLAFALGLTLILLGYVFWTLSRAKKKGIFASPGGAAHKKPDGEPHERSS